MPINYSKALNRIRAKREELIAQGRVLQRGATQALAEPTMAMNRQIQKSVPMVGTSVGARVQMGQDATQNMLRGQTQIMNSIPQVDTGALDTQIMNMEMAQDQQREDRKDNALKTGLQIGGAILGAAAGIPLGDPLGGAQTGAGLGQVASSFVGGGGDMALKYASPEEVTQGFADTVNGISSMTSLKDQKGLASDLVANFDALKTSGMMEQATLAILTQDMDLLREILNKVRPQ